MEPRRVHITTYGCQMNQVDTELAAQVLRDSGAEVVEDAASANVLLFVTCSVRAHAEDRVFSNIGALKARKRREPGLVIGLVGCMAQQYGARLRERAPLVDLVCGPGRLGDLPALVEEARAGRRAEALDPPRTESETGASWSDAALEAAEIARPLGGLLPGQSYVVAMRGCDNFCSYCVVPNVRGRERSRAPRSVIEEVRRLVGQGARRITFLGQAVNQYRAEEDGRRWDLADLLTEAAAAAGPARLAFITNHPKAMTERLARVFRDVPTVLPYLHMPAQSGSDAVLARMNRGYTAAEYAERVAMVREARPDVAVASDFIVGFPGETAEDFEATLDLVRRMRFAGAFVFKYSPRPGTAAERYADDVPIAEKRRRHKELLALVEQIAGEENQRFAGRTVRVLVEGMAPRPELNVRARQGERLRDAELLPYNPQSEIRNPKSVQLRGRTPCHRIVVFDGPPGAVGTEVDVAIWKAGPLTLFGKLVD